MTATTDGSIHQTRSASPLTKPEYPMAMMVVIAGLCESGLSRQIQASYRSAEHWLAPPVG